MGSSQSIRQTALRVAHELKDECLGVKLGRVHRLASRRYENALRPSGLTLTQVEILSALTLAGTPARPTDLAEQLLVERSTMSRNLSVLREQGLVSVANASPTGRSLAVAITPAGTCALARVRTAWSTVQGSVSTQLGSRAAITLEEWSTALIAEQR